MSKQMSQAEKDEWARLHAVSKNFRDQDESGANALITGAHNGIQTAKNAIAEAETATGRDKEDWQNWAEGGLQSAENSLSKAREIVEADTDKRTDGDKKRRGLFG
jgi:hypothetical protein